MPEFIDFSGVKECSELGNKLAAKLLIDDQLDRIIIPNYSEYIGLALLERDDELYRSKDKDHAQTSWEEETEKEEQISKKENQGQMVRTQRELE